MKMPAPAPVFFAVQKPFFKTAALGGVLRQLAVRLLKVLCEHTPLVVEHIVFLAVVNIEVTETGELP